MVLKAALIGSLLRLAADAPPNLALDLIIVVLILLVILGFIFAVYYH